MESLGVRINKRRHKLREKKNLITNNGMGMDTELKKESKRKPKTTLKSEY